MELILRKKHLKSEYIFYTNLIQKVKKGKVIKEINLIDIEEITYNEKFGLIDFIMTFVLRNTSSYSNFPKALVIYLKTKPKFISLRLGKKEYEILKNKFKKVIMLV